MSGPTVVCVGASVLDYQFGVDGFSAEEGKAFAHSYREVGGGPAATAAVAIARLGGTSHLLSRIGDDAVGDRIVADLEGEGVDASGILRLRGQSTVSAVLVDRSGRRSIVNYRDPDLPRDPSQMSLSAIDKADCVLADLRWPEASVAVMRRAKTIPRVIDADSTDDEAAANSLTLASHIVFSRPGLSALAEEADIEAGLRTMGARTGAFVAVTDGDDGYFWLADGAIHHAPAFRVDTVDTTGAGDVFHGAFALALANGLAEPEALRYASGAAALKCTKPGGRAGIPTTAELADFLRKAAA